MPLTEAMRARLSEIPIFKTLRLRTGEAAEGFASLTAPYEPVYDGIFKSFHGGLLMTLADTAACVAVLTLAGADAAVTTTDMNIRFFGAVPERCHGRGARHQIWEDAVPRCGGDSRREWRSGGRRASYVHADWKSLTSLACVVCGSSGKNGKDEG